MTISKTSIAVLLMLFALILLSGSALVWVASISGPQPTPAQNALIELSDWTVKGAVGAFLGFAGGTGLAGRNGSSSA